MFRNPYRHPTYLSTTTRLYDNARWYAVIGKGRYVSVLMARVETWDARWGWTEQIIVGGKTLAPTGKAA
jgi:hypothetical protein